MIELCSIIGMTVASFAAAFWNTKHETTKHNNRQWRDWCENLRPGYGPDGMDRDGNRP